MHLRVFLITAILVPSLLIGYTSNSAPPPAAAPPRVYTWRADVAAAIPGLSALIWAHVDEDSALNSHDGTVHRARDPIVVANEVARDMRTRSVDDRAVLMWHAGLASGPKGELPLFPGGDRALAGYADGGSIGFTREWVISFWQQIDSQDLKPSFVVLDYEAASGFWGMKRDFPRDSSVPASMPDWAVGTFVALSKLQSLNSQVIAGFKPIDFVREGGKWGWGRSAISAFDSRFMPIRRAAIFQGVFEPLFAVFGPEVPAGNYGEQLREWPGIDQNGWVQPEVNQLSVWSCPVTYLTTAGNFYQKQLASMPPSKKAALQWVHRRNDVRSAFFIHDSVAPWYSNPDFGAQRAEDAAEVRVRWAAGLLHDRVLGIRAFLIWSAGPWNADELAVGKKVFDAINRLSPQIGYDRSALSDLDPEESMKPWVQMAREIIDGRKPNPPGNIKLDNR